jgi:hypothetical protein
MFLYYIELATRPLPDGPEPEHKLETKAIDSHDEAQALYHAFAMIAQALPLNIAYRLTMFRLAERAGEWVWHTADRRGM